MTIDQTVAEILSDIKAGMLTPAMLRLRLEKFEMETRHDQINRDLTAALKIVGGNKND